MRSCDPGGCLTQFNNDQPDPHNTDANNDYPCMKDSCGAGGMA
jgi:hypothetical protein